MENSEQNLCLIENEAPGAQFFSNVATNAASVVIGASVGCFSPHWEPPGLCAIQQSGLGEMHMVLDDHLITRLPGARSNEENPIYGAMAEASPVGQHLRTLIDNLSMPKSWIEEGVEAPTSDCFSYTKRVLTRLFDTYGIIPYKITMSKEGGVFAAYKSPHNKNTLRLEIDNELDVVAVVSDGEVILDSGVLIEDDFEEGIVDCFNSQVA